jgi:hypothetical protein
MTIRTRSITKIKPYHSMTTRSHKPVIKKEIIIEKKSPPTASLLPAEFLDLSYRAINEVLELYHKNPNEVNLRYLQEAVSLTVRLHTHYQSKITI